jgi:rhomboid protease GluP
MFWLALIVIAGYVGYVMRPEERTRVIAIARRIAEAAWDEYCRRRSRPDAFRDALDARTRAPFLTAAVVLLNLLIFALMLVGDGRMSDADTLLRWGASAGPVTTNGEWWRLLTATFVHTGFLQLVLEMAALAQAGMLVERMSGHAAFAGLYLTSAAFAAAIGLWVDPLPVTAGASGAIFGMYGLLVALVVRGTLRRSSVTIPMPVVARLAPAAAMFIIYSWSAGGPQWTSGPATFVIGYAIGLALTRNLAERTPPARRVAGLAAPVLAIAAVIAAPLSGTVDVRSEISRLIAVEDRTTVTYQTATERFKRGALERDALARVIEHIIVPELEAVPPAAP